MKLDTSTTAKNEAEAPSRFAASSLSDEAAAFWKVVSTRAEMDSLQEARYRWLCRRLDLEAGVGEPIQRLVGVDDNTEATEHIIAYSGGRTAGAVSLRFATSNVQGGHGFELERAFRLTCRKGLRLAEVSRMCVDPDAPRSGALFELKRGMEALAEKYGLDGWVAAADCRAASQDEADRIYRAACALGLANQATTNIEPSDNPLSPRARRALYRSLPVTLIVFSRIFSARVIGEPRLHPAFPRFVIPVFAPVGFVEQCPSAQPQEEGR